MLTIEDGTGVPTADSWATVKESDDYATAIGNLAWLDLDAGEVKEPALRRGSRFINNYYGPRFAGIPTYGLEQSMSWPRMGFVSNEGIAFDSDYIPPQIKSAQIVAAFQEAVTPGSLTSGASGGTRGKKAVTVGPISVTYDDLSSSSSTTPGGSGYSSLLDALLWPFLDSAKPGAGGKASMDWLKRA